MSRKKETKELIEILLRQQREQRPSGSDPLEGIEWEGLPPELRDRVYKPTASQEPLVEFLTSPLTGHTQLAGEPARPAGDAPEKAPAGGFLQRLSAWFFDLCTLLNKTYEVRLATVLAFCAAALVVAFLAYLWGWARGRATLPIYKHAAAPHLLLHTPPAAHKAAPVRQVQPAQKGQLVRSSERTGSGSSPSPARPSPSGGTADRLHSIAVATAPSKAQAEKLCSVLVQRGLAGLQPRYYQVRGGWFVLVGRWKSAQEAQKQLATLKRGVFADLKQQGLIVRLDQYVFENLSKR